MIVEVSRDHQFLRLRSGEERTQAGLDRSGRAHEGISERVRNAGLLIR